SRPGSRPSSAICSASNFLSSASMSSSAFFCPRIGSLNWLLSMVSIFVLSSDSRDDFAVVGLLLHTQAHEPRRFRLLDGIDLRRHLLRVLRHLHARLVEQRLERRIVLL